MFARARAALASPNSSKRLFDYFYANLLYALPSGLRRRMYAGDAHYCPICESSLRTFLALHRPYHRYCPVCRSLQRYRLVWLFFNSRYVQIGDQPARMLHIAPEPALAWRFQQVPGLSYLSADLYNSSAMIVMDISDIRYPDSSFDVIYCSHVLEHVPDDHRALAEFHRVLSPGGYAVLLVPILSPSTLEDLAITSPEERQRVYGQHDHLRSYGPDFKERVEQAGFQVVTVVARDLVEPGDLQRMSLGDDDVIFYARRKD